MIVSTRISTQAGTEVVLAATVTPNGVVYRVGDVTVHRDDFLAVLAVTRVDILEFIAQQVGTDGLISTALAAVAENLDPDIEGSLAAQLLVTLGDRGA